MQQLSSSETFESSTPVKTGLKHIVASRAGQQNQHRNVMPLWFIGSTYAGRQLSLHSCITVDMDAGGALAHAVPGTMLNAKTYNRRNLRRVQVDQ